MGILRCSGSRSLLFLLAMGPCVSAGGPAQTIDSLQPATPRKTGDLSSWAVDNDALIRTRAAVLHNPCKGPHVDIERLNQLGADTSFPPYADTITGVTNPLRANLLCDNVTYRIFNPPSFSYNTLQGPVAKAQEVFIGQRPTWSMGPSLGIIADLTALHLPGVQFNMTAIYGHASWFWAFANTLKMAQLVVYKPWFHDRLSVKAGYQDNDAEFVGSSVGGSMSSGSQGVYAVLPYEVGLSYMPLTSPTAIVRAQPVSDFYFKAGVQRSISASGEPADLRRDAAGFRFDPKGDRLLKVFEGGFNRAARPDAREFWVRGGYFVNNTPFANLRTQTSSPGNNCEFLLVDRQLRQSDRDQPGKGLYAGVSFIRVPPAMNAYTHYYEARIYKMAPFRHRASDLLSVVSSYSNYSRYFVNADLAAGKTAATHAATLTGSYSMRIRPGTYIIAGMSYDSRPAVTPRLPGALTVTTSAALFF